MGTGKVFRSIKDIRLRFSSFLTVEFNQTAILSLSPLPATRTVPVVGGWLLTVEFNQTAILSLSPLNWG